jgi:thiamine kinase-like enzyme
MNETIVRSVTSKALNVYEQDIVIERRLMGGMSNYTYLINVKGDRYTFRIPGKNAEKFVDREIEDENIKRIESLDLNNVTVFLDTKKGYKIAKYIEGQPLSELNPLEFLDQVSVLLHKIHDRKLTAINDYDHLERLHIYESYNQEFGYQMSDRYNSLKSAFVELIDEYYHEESFVLCHGDSQISNFVVSGDQLKLMDWEFTGNNHPFYDIACFGNNDFDHAIALLPVYLGREATDFDLNQLHFFRMFQTLQWHNVALYKHFIGLSEDLNIDFMSVAELYLNKAEKMLKQIKSH